MTPPVEVGVPANSRRAGVLMACIGARQHYEVPVILHRAGLLRRLIVDSWNRWGYGMRRVANLTRLGWLKGFAGRYREELPARLVVSLGRFGIRYWLRCQQARNRAALYGVFEQEGRRFAEECIKHLDVEHSVFFGYSSASLEVLRREKKSGRWCVLDQIDPARTEYRIVLEEEARFPDLVADASPIPESYFRRLEAEWDEASLIVVNSEWSKRALVEQGVDPLKIVIVPLAFEGPPSGFDLAPRRSNPDDPLRVLWLGTLCLRKGLPYALEAAKLLLRAPVRFTFAGPSQVALEKLHLPENCRYVGAVPRIDAHTLYTQHDVFLLPTLSDGFAITQIEALAYGLPVISTPCCGDVVEDGKCGFLVPPRDGRSIAESILKFVEDRDLLCQMSIQARKRAREFSPQRLCHRWLAVVGANPANAR